MQKHMRLAVGIGCDRGVSLATLEQTLAFALARIGASLDMVVTLASIDKKNDEEALLEFSQRHGWPIHFFSAEDLAVVDVPNPSETVRKYMGTPAVSEAAALLAADTDKKHLLVEKYKYLGADGKNATVSIARVGR